MLSSLFLKAANYLPPMAKIFNNAADYFEQHEKKAILYAQFKEEIKLGTFDEMDACQRISYSVHGKKFRRDGRPYVESHIKSVVDTPNRYVDIIYSPDQEKLAWVHDTPEDARGAWRVKHFRRMGFSNEFCEGLDGHTIRPGEKYLDYIERLSKTIALEVKIGDNRHNWADNPKPHKANLYRISSHYLLAVKYGRIAPGSSIAEWAAQEGMYDAEIFGKYSSRPIIKDYISPRNKLHMSGIPAPIAV